jgi:molybdopterin molybdotransferase
MLSVEAARAKVIEVMGARAENLPTETIDVVAAPGKSLGRILAENIIADRNYPPFNRSIRDGYAVRAADVTEPGAKLRLVGESRAGVGYSETLAAGECVRILTGAPVPRGANAVVMQEYARVEGNSVIFAQAVQAEQHFVHAGAEARIGETIMTRGAKLSYAELAVVAEVGRTKISVYRRPRVAILSSGDELVDAEQTPGRFQIRNSNSISIAAQVALAGGEAEMLGIAPDEIAALSALIKRGLECDLLVMSGGVSVGAYDLAEAALQELGAKFFFDAVAIRPGKPAVFGWCHDKPVFGLPGNPVSTMVTFELFARPAIEMLCGFKPQALPFFKAKLKHPINEKGNVAHFLPARISWADGDPVVEVMLWEGSGDIGAVVRGNCFVRVHESKLHLEAGEWVDILPRRATF